MKKYIIILCTMACCSASAQRIYVEDMSVARNSLPQIPTTITAIKKDCNRPGKPNNCNSLKAILEGTIKIRIDSMNIPLAMTAEDPSKGPGMLLIPEMAEQKKLRMDALDKSIDSMEKLLQTEHILTIKNGKSDYHETPKYGQALRDLANRLRTPLISNSYYHMNYQQREAYRESIYIFVGIEKVKINHFLAYEKMIFEKNKKNVFDVLSISGVQQSKITEMQTKCAAEISNLKDSLDNKFKEISDWKQKELAKAKTPAANAAITEQAATKTQKLLSSTHTLLINRYNSLIQIYDEHLTVFYDALKCYEFGLNATTNQEKQMQNMIAQTQLAGYITMNSLANFCVFAHETIIKYSGK